MSVTNSSRQDHIGVSPSALHERMRGPDVLGWYSGSWLFKEPPIRLEMKKKKIYRVVENQFLLSLSVSFIIIIFTFRFDILELSFAMSPLSFGARYNFK